MKRAIITKEDYDDLVYAAVALAVHEKTAGALRMCDHVLTLLEAQGRELPPADSSLWAMGQTKAPPPLFVMRGSSFAFEFEDAHAEYLVGKLIDLAERMEGRFTRRLPAIINQLEKEYLPEDGIKVSADVKEGAPVSTQ